MKRNVQGQIITKEKKCTETNYIREGTNVNKQLKSEQLTRTFAVLVDFQFLAGVLGGLALSFHHIALNSKY